ncbi:eukaryotic translation initiation factor 4 gamma 1 [Trichonephila clavipes]|nr:eukaryotic translation initiation factor 4 gamma 1 [Trichonephila clavipes]
MSLLLAGQKEASPAHGYFCMDSNVGCSVEFYAPYSQVCPVFGQFPEHCTVASHHSTPPALLWPLLQLPRLCKLRKVWRESGLQWTDFLGNDANVCEFIKKHKLEFTLSPTKVRSKTQMSIEEMKKHLMSLLEESEENEEIFDWIDICILVNVLDNADPNFIRALVTVVHEYAIKETDFSYALDLTKLKNRTSLLTRYIDHKDQLELQTLYALQALMNNLGHPSGLLHQIFDILHDDDVITEEAFKDWELNDDPNEAEGKGVAVNSVKSFFMRLREPDEADY